MKLLTYKGHPVINLEQVCSMKIIRDNLVLFNKQFPNHSIVFFFHNTAEKWKMESEEEATFIHEAIIEGILKGNEHIILEETKEELITFNGSIGNI